MKKRIVIMSMDRWGMQVLRYYRATKTVESVLMCNLHGTDLSRHYMSGTPEITYDEAMNLCDGNTIYILPKTHVNELMCDMQQRGVGKCSIKIYSPNVYKCSRSEYSVFYVMKRLIEQEQHPIVYSFGIGEDLSFSEEMIEKFNAEVYAFDPTPKAIKFVHDHWLSGDERFHFFPIGVSDYDGEEVFYLPKNPDHVSAAIIKHDGVDENNSLVVPMKSIGTIMNSLGHSYIDIIKMDIEGSEFKVIPSIIRENIPFGQICMEMHERFFTNPDTKRGDFLEELVKAGMIDYYSHDVDYLIVDTMKIVEEDLFIA